MTSIYLVKSVFNTESNMEKQWRCGTSRNSTASALSDHSMWFVFDDKRINYQRIWPTFSYFKKKMFVYIPYKIWKHILIRIVFIASIYELFDNPSYWRLCCIRISFYISISIDSEIFKELWNIGRCVTLSMTRRSNIHFCLKFKLIDNY